MPADQGIDPAGRAGVGRIQLRLLDGFELTIDGGSAPLPPSAQRLIAFLALQQRPVVRSHVAGLLWGEHSERRAAACLRSAIWRSNSVHDAEIVDASRSHLRLNDDVQVDAQLATALARQQLSGDDPVPTDLLTGELLPGWYEDWVLVERERMRQLCLQAMERAAKKLLDAGQVDLAIEAAVNVVTAEPLRESAHRVLIDAYVAAGNRGEALRQYERCCDILYSELGLLPGEALAASAALAHGPAVVTATAREVLASSPEGVRL